MNSSRPLPSDLWEREELIDLPIEVRWTGAALHFHADGFGRGRVHGLHIKRAAHPTDDVITAGVIEEHMLMLEQVGYLALYTSAGETFYQIVPWRAISRPGEPRCPAPPLDLVQKKSGFDLDEIQAVESEREGASESDERVRERDDEPRAFRPRLPDEPPELGCSEHPGDMTERPCGPCMAARLRFQRWQAQQRGDAHRRMTG